MSKLGVRYKNLFRLVADIEFEAKDVSDACKKLIKLFKKISKGEKEEDLVLGGNLEIMSLDWEVNNVFERPKKLK